MKPSRPQRRKTSPKYRVAISFAGPQRAFAEAVALHLQQHGIRVFYDRFEQHMLWGRNLHETLARVYNKSCRYCIMVLTPEYLERMWPTFERQHLIGRLAQERGGDFLLPVRLDGFEKEVPGLPGGLGHLSAGSENPQVVAETFLAKIGSDIALFDPGRSYKKAIELLEESGGLGDRLRPDRIFSSIGQINRTFPSKRRLDLQWLHGFLGYRFFWRKRPSEWLQLFAADVSDEQPEYKRICEINVPEEWNGIGQWVHVVIDYERREDRRRENTRSRSGSRRTDKPKIDEEEEKRVLIPLYLQSPGVDPAFPSLRHKEYESRRPLAAFLGAFLLDPPKSDQFYYLASQRFKSIE